jgi:hypothetical protein
MIPLWSFRLVLWHSDQIYTKEWLPSVKLLIILGLLVLLSLAIVLFGLRFTDSDYPFAIFKLFLMFLHIKTIVLWKDTKGVIRIRISKKNRQPNGQKIPKGKSESVYRRRRDNTMAKEKVQKDKQGSTKHTLQFMTLVILWGYKHFSDQYLRYFIPNVRYVFCLTSQFVQSKYNKHALSRRLWIENRRVN